MKQTRLEQLADGIFAIVMTLLVLNIHVPVLPEPVDNGALLQALKDVIPLLLSYLLSFSLLFTYWRAHHFTASVYAKNIDTKFTNINALFLFFVALVPFTSNLLGLYSSTHVAIFIFALDVVCVGLTLYWMRRYVAVSKTIENENVSTEEDQHAYTRILFPVFCALVAVIVSFFNPNLSFFLFTIGILFNLSRRSTRIIFGFVRPFLTEREKSNQI